MIVLKRLKEIAEKIDTTFDKVESFIKFLQFFGYLPKELKDLDSDTLNQAVSKLQRQYGSSVTGEVDAKTLRIAELPRCGCPDFLVEEARGVNKWGISTLNYFIKGRDSDLSSVDWDDIIGESWYEWQKVCGLTFKRVDKESQAHLISDVGSGRTYDFDGPGRVLAWHQLPPSSSYTGQLLGMADSAEKWDRNLLKRTWVHEGGHGLGFSHSNDPNDVMYPTLREFMSPQAGDIKRAVDYYGNPVAQPQPEPEPIPGGNGWEKFTVEFEARGFRNVNIPGYRVSKMG